jgi:hypothetical protein
MIAVTVSPMKTILTVARIAVEPLARVKTATGRKMLDCGMGMSTSEDSGMWARMEFPAQEPAGRGTVGG